MSRADFQLIDAIRSGCLADFNAAVDAGAYHSARDWNGYPALVLTYKKQRPDYARRLIALGATGRDRYRRTLADIYVGKTRINAVMIAKGFAWHYAQYNDEYELAKMHRTAKDKKIGLWSLPDPVAPWDWRKQRRSERKPK